MNPITRFPLSAPVRFGAKPKAKPPQDESADKAPQVQKHLMDHKASKVLSYLAGTAMSMAALCLGLDVTDAATGQNVTHFAGIESTSNAVDIGANGLLVLLNASLFGNSRRARKKATQELNRLGYIVQDSQLVKIESDTGKKPETSKKTAAEPLIYPTIFSSSIENTTSDTATKTDEVKPSPSRGEGPEDVASKHDFL